MLAPFVRVNEWGNQSLDFADPEAQRALTTALLQVYYSVPRFTLPKGFLCPSIPGRADHLHHAADLLAELNDGAVPRGERVRALDVGTGASGIYPLLGHAEFGWSFVGSEVEREALDSVIKTIETNPSLGGAIEVRLQPSPAKTLTGVVRPEDRFDLTLCNPPFHSSAREAEEGSRRKWKNLGKGGKPGARPALNFGGRSRELWCAGGETAFVRGIIEESAACARRVLWFTSLLARSEHLPALERALRLVRAVETRTVEMRQGQKTSRLLAWTFLSARERAEWARRWR